MAAVIVWLEAGNGWVIVTSPKVVEKSLYVTNKSILPVGIGRPEVGGAMSAKGTSFVIGNLVDLKIAVTHGRTADCI